VFVELIDRLRCPNVHADSWLVAAATRTAHRHLLDATLACPECHAEFEVRDGELWIGAVVASAAMQPADEDVMRTAALLKLEERGLFLLDGGWAALAPALQELLDVDLLLADPPSAALAGAGQGTLRGVGDRWPLADASVHGLAIGRVTDARLADAVRVLRPRGRLVAPADAPLPMGVAELARDARHWVAEKTPDVVPLTRARR
jgi:hypothetical protein